MTELVERYVHQVGRNLPKKERADIEAELRSLIQDQLDDRFEETPSSADVAAVLSALGDPRQMATSYGSQQYLIGPDLYPNMMMVLRLGWLRVPAIVVSLSILWALASDKEGTLFGLFFETAFVASFATLMFTAIVVLIFAILQQSDVELDEQDATFDPLALPAVDDPATVDHFEVAFGMALGMFGVFVFLYFLRVGGLTLRFNLNDPGDVIPVSTAWLSLLIAVAFSQIIVQLLVLRRNRWGVGSILTQLALELIGTVCLYIVAYEPIAERIFTTTPALADIPTLGWIPEIISISYASATLMSSGHQLAKMCAAKNETAPLSAQTNGQIAEVDF